MVLANILTDVANTASTGLELNMEFVRNINGDISITIGQIMLVIATRHAINHKELKECLKTYLLTTKIRKYLFTIVL